MFSVWEDSCAIGGGAVMRKLRPETLLRRYKTSCILASCRKRIPMKRQRRRSITCSKEHQKLLTRMRKIERDLRLCSHCGRPVSQDEKSAFRRWRHSHSEEAHRKNPKAAKEIRGAANATVKMSDFAYVVELGPKSTHRSKRGKGAAA
jgi:hypothetical protein